MVVGLGNMDAAGKRQSSSANLKFGMDRILSNRLPLTDNLLKTSSPSSNPNPQSEVHLPLSYIGAGHCRTRYGNPYHLPCSSLRSHQSPSFLGYSICVPQPLRPYTNVVLASGEHDSSSSAQCLTQQKRKRSWSRAVFSNLQRKGLEKRFQLQKYITKPDRRQLAATLGLTDAQVKVWFQNRRMKWRHAKEGTREGKPVSSESNTNASSAVSSTNRGADLVNGNGEDSESRSDVDIDIQTVDSTH